MVDHGYLSRLGDSKKHNISNKIKSQLRRVKNAYLDGFPSAIIKHKRLVWRYIIQHLFYSSKSGIYQDIQESRQIWIRSSMTYKSIDILCFRFATAPVILLLCTSAFILQFSTRVISVGASSTQSQGPSSDQHSEPRRFLSIIC
ncbi:unnamed protein product, partial [Vitis vinifera]